LLREADIVPSTGLRKGLVTVSALRGHADVATTEIYTPPNEWDLPEVVNGLT